MQNEFEWYFRDTIFKHYKKGIEFSKDEFDSRGRHFHSILELLNNILRTPLVNNASIHLIFERWRHYNTLDIIHNKDLLKR